MRLERRVALIALALSSAISCDRTPTAREVFQLRSDCATAAEKMMKMSPYLNRVPRSSSDPDPEIRYDEKANRCYVEIYRSDTSEHIVLDGQTGQELAYTNQWGSPTARHYHSRIEGRSAFEAEDLNRAEAYINELMGHRVKTDTKQR